MQIIINSLDLEFETLQDLLNVFEEASSWFYCGQPCIDCGTYHQCLDLNTASAVIKRTLVRGCPSVFVLNTEHLTNIQLLEVKNIFVKARRILPCDQSVYCHACKDDRRCLHIDDIVQKLSIEVERRIHDD